MSINRTLKQNKRAIAPKSNLTKSFFPLESLKVSPCQAINAVTIINTKSIVIIVKLDFEMQKLYFHQNF